MPCSLPPSPRQLTPSRECYVIYVIISIRALSTETPGPVQ